MEIIERIVKLICLIVIAISLAVIALHIPDLSRNVGR